MTATLTRLRPLLIGLVVLMFTAGIAFAGKPSTPAAGLTVASEASGKTVPVRAGSEQEDEDEDESTEAEDEETETEEAGENCTTDPTGLSPEDLALVRHGSVVCWAAHQETPEGYANRGAWISEWAKKNRGHDFGAEEEDASAESTAASSHGNGKAQGPKNR
ncbi:MAG: hypothetical protein L0227_14345 [Chloroflexi bacterium]|nr:hypothetical protein [Chloroflexota bacterium]